MKKRQLYTDPGILGKADPSRGVLCTAGSPRQWKRVCQGEARKAPKKKHTSASSSTNRKRSRSKDQDEERLQRPLDDHAQQHWVTMQEAGGPCALGTGREDGSQLPRQASTSPPPPAPQVEQVSTPPDRGGDGSYAEKRLVNIQHNKNIMENLGIITPSNKLDVGGARVPSKKQNHSDEVASTYSSPTRKKTNLQNQEILVVLGGEIHCNSPVHAKAFNLLLPLSSERANKLLVWKGMETVLR
jgi:hypothetical protein